MLELILILIQTESWELRLGFVSVVQHVSRSHMEVGLKIILGSKDLVLFYITGQHVTPLDCCSSNAIPRLCPIVFYQIHLLYICSQLMID